MQAKVQVIPLGIQFACFIGSFRPWLRNSCLTLLNATTHVWWVLISARLSPPPSLALTLSLHLYPYVCIPLRSSFIRYNKQISASAHRALCGQAKKHCAVSCNQRKRIREETVVVSPRKSFAHFVCVCVYERARLQNTITNYSQRVFRKAT